MALVTKPPALDESINTTELSPRNVADVLAQELSGIATAISGGSDKAPKTDIATVEPTNVASRAYNKDELVYVNGNLYKVITAIASGATFTVGTNIQSTNVSDEIKSINNFIEVGTVNFSTGVNVFGHSCVKRNGVVTLTVELNGNTFSIGTPTTIGTIEDGFRPYGHRLLITGYVDNGALRYVDAAVVQLGADGTILLSPNANGFIVFSVSYVANK